MNINSLLNDCIFEILQHPDLCQSDIEAAGKTCQRWSEICDDITKKKRKEASEISDSWENIFRPSSCMLTGKIHVVDYIPPLSQVASAAALARQGFHDAISRQSADIWGCLNTPPLCDDILL